jgi:hypothetical protein
MEYREQEITVLGEGYIEVEETTEEECQQASPNNTASAAQMPMTSIFKLNTSFTFF